MNLEINVTEQDIKEGENYQGVYNSCPIAIALRRAGCEEIDADEDRILITVKGNRYVYKTPREVMLFIDDFDNGQTNYVKPIKFTLEKPKLATIDDERKPLSFPTTKG